MRPPSSAPTTPILPGRLSAPLAVDLASQLVLSVAEHSVARYHPGFPIGRGKLEALAVIACACIMSMASLEVAQFSAIDLYRGFAKGKLARGGRRVLGRWSHRNRRLLCRRVLRRRRPPASSPHLLPLPVSSHPAVGCTHLPPYP